MENPFQQLSAQILAINEVLTEIQDEIRGRKTSEKKYYTVSEAAARLNVSRITLYRQIKSNTIPYKKIGARIMIPGSYVDGN